jgi:quercetin dioxygenase-like cupin family protein
MAQVTMTPWRGETPPQGDQIAAIFAAERLAPYTWSNGPNEVYSPHSHTYHKVLVVLSGSITFGLPVQGRSVELRAGDRLDLPA